MRRSNLFYRRPDLYDELQDTTRAADMCLDLVAAHGPPDAATALDLGCGTGKDLARLAEVLPGAVGVDVQEHMLAHARAVRPHLELHVGDLRTVRLGRRFDAVLCLGDTLAYLHGDDDLAAAFGTFAAHARPGAVLVVATPTSAPPGTGGAYRVRTANLRADVVVSHEWDPVRRISTTHREWSLDNGTTARDVLRRRVLAPEELTALAVGSGFRVVEAGDNRLVAVARPGA